MNSHPSRKLFHPNLVIAISGIVTLSVAGLYLSIAPDKLTNAHFGSDGGDFLAAVLTRGIPHPTGYPTYVMLGNIFQLLPASTPVFRAVLESLMPAALGAGLLTGWMVYILGVEKRENLAAALITGTAWGVAPLLFSQAVIVEVHGLQSLIDVLVLWWITLNLGSAPGKNRKWLLGLAFLAGVGTGNHLTIALFAPAAIVAFTYALKKGEQWKFILAQLGLVLSGMLVYLYLPLRAGAYPAINWGNPQSWSGFFWEISADPYRQMLFRVPAADLWDRVRSIASLFLDQFGALGLIAGVFGVVLYSFRVKWLRWVLAWIFIAYLAFAIGYASQDSVSYLIPAILVFAIWIGLAVPSLWSLPWKRLPLGMIIVTVLALSTWARVPGTRSKLDPRKQDQPARYAEQLLSKAPSNAIVNTTTDQDTFPLWYYHFGLKERADLRIVVLPLTQFVWYQQTMLHTYPDLKFPAITETNVTNADWGKAITSLNPGRPVCNTKITSEAETGVSFECSSP